MGQTLRRLAISLCLLCSFLFVASSFAQSSLQKLHKHVPSVVANGKAALVGALPNTQRIQLTLMLALRNQAALTSLLGQLYDPSSPEYRHFLTVQQFTDQFGPTQQDYDTVIKYAQGNGLTIVGQSKNRLNLDVSGTVGQIDKLFNVSMNLYRAPNSKRTFYSIDREPTFNFNVPIVHVEGLNDYSVPQPMVHIKKNASPVANVTGAGPGGYYLGSDMRAAYYGGTLLTGAGQCVGLFEFGGYRLSDVNLTFNNAGQSYSVPINNVLIDGASAAAGSDDAEQVLDIAQAIGMAPGLSQVRVYIGPSGDDADILNAMATEDTCKQLSVSWSWGPDDPTTDDGIFEEFAAQGQSLFVASGDYGAYDPSVSPYFYPAEDAYVTAVGATDLTTDYAGGPWVAESAWNSSGGGVSPSNIPLPNWQQQVANDANAGSVTYRNVPDVAMEGDTDNFYCDLGNCSGGAGGTSFAAARWAGFMALINQQATEAGTAPSGGLGFLNPTLYSLGESSSFATDFHDITSGNNDSANQQFWYSAVTGYDLVTGWGSPNGQSLIDALAGTITPGFWITSSPPTLSLTPGSSATAMIAVTDAGGFTGNVTLTASGLPSGVTASFNPSPTGTTSELTLTAGSSTATGTATVTITGTSGSSSAKTQVFLTVNPSQASSPPAGNFGTVNVGSTSSPTTVTLTLLTAGTIGNISTLTQGSPNLDFTSSSGGTCAIGNTYRKAGATCTVNVAFTPKYAGTRFGAVVLSDSSGNRLAQAFVQGTGIAPQIAFNPGTQTTVGSGFIAPEGAAMLGNGSIYVTDYGNSGTAGSLYLESLSNGTYTQTKINCTFKTPVGVAVDGSGTVYVADPGARALYKIEISNGTCTQTSIESGLLAPWGVAVDGSGNVYIADIGFPSFGEVGGVYKETLQANGTYLQSTIGSGWLEPSGITVDTNGNVDVTDYSIPGVFRETPSGGGYIQTPIDHGWTAPSGIAIDQSGNLYVSDPGNSIYYGGQVPAGVYKESFTNGTYVRTPMGNSWSLPSGIAVDASGNLFVADNARGVYKEDLADPPELGFENSVAGTTSADSPETVIVSNSGTSALAFSSLTYPADFPEAAGIATDCSSSSSLQPTGTCTLSIDFTPTEALGTNTSVLLNENVAISTDDLNQSATQQTIPVIGTEVLPGGSVTLSVSSNPGVGGAPIAFTATVTGTAGGLTPTGTITFLNGATPLGSPVVLTNGVASYSTSSLSIGTYQITASYSGDSNYQAATSNAIAESIITPPATSPFGNTSIGNQNIGSTSSAIPLTVTFTSAATLGGIAVLTEGAANLDFTNAGGGTCAIGTAYTANASCTVDISFSPKYPGTRYGAVVLTDNNGNVIGTGYLEGTGVGPQTSFPPGTLTSAVTGLGYPEGMAVDGSNNLYIADAYNAAVYKETYSNGTYTQSSIGSEFSKPFGVAIDSAGNIYVADSGNHAVYKETLVAGSYVQTEIGYGFVSPMGVAVDGEGNVYVADFGNGVTPGAVYLETLSSGSYTQSTVTGTFNTPQSVAVDGNGNIFVADSANGNGTAAVYELTPSNGSYSQLSIGSGWSTPSGVAVDSQGNLYIADDAFDTGNGFVNKETLQPGGTYIQSTVFNNTSMQYPGGVVVDGSGNLYISDNLESTVYRDDLVDPPSLSFATTLYGSTSSDSPRTVTVQNAGNATLAFSAVNYPADFPETTGVASDCTSQSSFAPGTTCTMSVAFKPSAALSTTQPTPLAENATITTNSLGASTQNIALSGTEAPSVVAVVLSAPSNVYTVGATINLTVTVSGGSGFSAPTGSVIFYSNGTALSTSALASDGTATYSTSSLAIGTYSITAVYSGDQVYPSATSNAINEMIIPSSTFGTQSVDSSTTNTITVTFSSRVTLGSIAVVTQGMPNLDFTDAGGGTCAAGTAYAAGSTCTVNVAFKPLYSGTRYGAVVLGDSSGNLIQSIPMQGTGVGPQIDFPSTTANIALAYPGVNATATGPITVDGSGNVYVYEQMSDGANNELVKWTESNGTYSSQVIPTSAANGFFIAVDGGGSIYVSNTYTSKSQLYCNVLKESFVGGSYKESTVKAGTACTSLNGWGTWPIAVDGQGNLYISQGDQNRIVKEQPSGSSYAESTLFTETTASNGLLYSPWSIAVDGSGNIYLADSALDSSTNLYSWRILQLSPSGGSYTQRTIWSEETPYDQSYESIYVDKNDNVYYMRQYQGPNGSTKEFDKLTPSGAGYSQSVVIPGAYIWGGAGIDDSDNIYTAQFGSGGAFEVARIDLGDPRNLAFVSTAVGSTSSDSPKEIAIENAGNAPLIVSAPSTGTNPSISSNFSLATSTTCPQVTTSGLAAALNASNSCAYDINFNPIASGSISGSLVLTDNALGAGGGVQTLHLDGTGTAGSTGNAVIALLRMEPGETPQVKWLSNASQLTSVDISEWVQVGVPFTLGLAVFEQGTCTEIGPGNITSVDSDLLGNTVAPSGTANWKLSQCGNNTYQWATWTYTWNTNQTQAVLKDPYTLTWAQPSNMGNALVNVTGNISRISISSPIQSGSGSNPPLTATASLINPPVSATSYTWTITGGGGAIVFPNGQETMSSTNPSIKIEEPNLTGSSVSFSLKVGVSFTDSIGSGTLTYGPAEDAFCGTPTITSISPNIWFAGQSNDITITGTGFNPTASQSCAQSNVMVSMANGGKVSTTVTAITPTQITATVTPVATDSTGGATVAIVGAPAPAPNADVLGDPVITWASDPDGSNPAISGPNATLPNPSAVAGQQLSLTTAPTADDLAALPIPLTFSTTAPTAWALIGGTNIGGYTPNQLPATVTPLTLDKSSVTFYSVYPPVTVDITYTYCVAQASTCLSSSTSFSVTGPVSTDGTMSVTPSPDLTVAALSLCITSQGTYPEGPYLIYGEGAAGLACPNETTFTKFGMQFNSPTGYSDTSGGNFLLAQLISSESINGTSYSPGLDTGYPYPGPFPTNDNPAVYLGTSPTTIRHTIVLNTFLMWQSSTANSIPIPLGYQAWGFDSSATCSNSCGTPANWTIFNYETPGKLGSWVESSPSQVNAGNNTLVDGYPTWTEVSQ